MRRTSALMPVAGILALAACTQDATVPTANAPIQMSVAPVAYDQSAADASGGTYVVRFKSNTVSAAFAAKVAALGGQIVFSHGEAGVAAVAGLDDARAAELATVSDVEAIDADDFTTIDRPSSATLQSVNGLQSPNNPARAAFFGLQWNMRAIHAPEAWAHGDLGKSSTKVGIIDTGLDYLSPDLYGRVDLGLSKSFLSKKQNARVQAAFPGAHEIADLHLHGTHVGATVSSNALVAAGVTSKVTLVGLKVCYPDENYDGVCPTSSTMAAVIYAADHQIPVVNMSLGGSIRRKDPGYKSLIKSTFKVMTYARLKGTLVVVAAGNAGIDMDRNPKDEFMAYCDAPFVTCVSATGPTGGSFGAPVNVDALAPYSNFGRNVAVAAPGGDFLPVVAVCSGFTIIPGFEACQRRFYDPKTGAGFSIIIGASGTSMASPHVAGLAALLHGMSLRPNPFVIDLRLRSWADDLGDPGFDPKYGRGRINVWNAMRQSRGATVVAATN